MRLDNTFSVTAPIGEVWDTIMVFERVAGCLPGASVVARGADDFDVTMRVKLGPIAMQYMGTLEVVERDAGAHRAVLRGRAQEAKGQGTADGTVELLLTEDGDVTRGSATADVKLSGRAAAMGAGLINKVAEQLMAQFATNLQALLNTSTVSAPDGGIPERSGSDVVEGVEALAAGTQSRGVERDPDDATPGTAPVEQVAGDPAMTRGRTASGAPPPPPAEPEALDALALAGGLVRGQLSSLRVRIAAGVAVAALLAWVRRKARRRR